MNKTSYRRYRSVSLPPGDLLGRVFQLLPQVWMMMMMRRRRIIRIVMVMVRAMMMVPQVRMMMVMTVMAMMTENEWCLLCSGEASCPGMHAWGPISVSCTLCVSPLTWKFSSENMKGKTHTAGFGFGLLSELTQAGLLKFIKPQLHGWTPNLTKTTESKTFSIKSRIPKPNNSPIMLALANIHYLQLGPCQNGRGWQETRGCHKAWGEFFLSFLFNKEMLVCHRILSLTSLSTQIGASKLQNLNQNWCFEK